MIDRVASVVPQADDGSVILAQLSDPHLLADRDNVFLGINPYDSLSRVVRQLRDEPGVDLVLASGDLSQDHSEASYRLFAELVAPLNKPVVALPGNHDAINFMARSLADTPVTMPPRIMLGDWQMILLNSAVTGLPSGHVPLIQQSWLKRILEETEETPTLIALHHHPVPTHCAWLDQHSLDNGAEFLALLNRFPQVKAVLFGHIHQEMDCQVGDLRLLAVPSTSIQFLPNSKGFVLDSRQPGYRLLRLYPDGSIETQVKRLTGGEFVPDPSASGY